MDNFDILKTNSTIGVCAPSMGCSSDDYHQKRCKNAIKNFEKLGHKIIFSDSCFNNEKARSATAEKRALEFEKMFFDVNVDGIISMAGGEFELEILPYLNFNKIKKAPNKLFQGFSDNTCIGFLLTTLCDKTTLYASNFQTFGMKKWYKNLKDNYDFITGKDVVQKSYKKYEEENKNHEPGKELKGYNLTKRTRPVILSCEKEINLSGRIVGGCLDILTCICGTKFDKVKQFCKKYKDDGIIWFFESCDLSVLEQLRSIWQLKNAGWFDNAKAILIGRPRVKETLYDCDYKSSNYEQLKDLKIPVVIDLDIGHTAPSWFILNGGKINFTCNKKEATIRFEI